MKKFFCENPAVKSSLGLTAAVAATATLWGGLTAGLLSLMILTIDMLLLSLIGRSMGTGAKVFASLVIAAGLASVAQLAMSALMPALADRIGWLVPLAAASGLVVVLAPAKSNESPGRAVGVGLVTGLSYTLLLVVVGLVREILGAGTIGDASLGFTPMALIGTPFGGFLILGIVAALAQWLGRDRETGQPASAQAEQEERR